MAIGVSHLRSGLTATVEFPCDKFHLSENNSQLLSPLGNWIHLLRLDEVPTFISLLALFELTEHLVVDLPQRFLLIV
jgi:hypothetical protein